MRMILMAGFTVVLLVTGAWAEADAGNEQSTTGDSVDRTPEPRLLDPTNNLLWILDSERENLSSEFQRLLTALDASQVPSLAEARRIATRFVLLAEEGPKTVGLIRMGRDVPQFAQRGDLVWVVHISSVTYSGAVNQGLWISSSSGEVRVMLPVRPR